MKPIEGKVAKLLNARELVINRGSTDGVGIGMVFEILDQDHMDVTDPETGESLGSVNRPKFRVKVAHVEDRLAVARTFRKTRVNRGGHGTYLAGLAGAARMMEPPNWVETTETFRADEELSIDPKKSIVKIGDVARQVLTDPDDGTA